MYVRRGLLPKLTDRNLVILVIKPVEKNSYRIQFLIGGKSWKFYLYLFSFSIAKPIHKLLKWFYRFTRINFEDCPNYGTQTKHGNVLKPISIK